MSFAGVLQILHQTLEHTLRNVFCIVVWFIVRSYFFALYFVTLVKSGDIRGAGASSMKIRSPMNVLTRARLYTTAIRD